MSYNEQTLNSLIKKANFFYKAQESSLGPVLAAMHQPRPTQTTSLRQAIALMLPAKREKYREALAYIELEYAGAWLGVPQPPTPTGLRREAKIGWIKGMLRQETIMVHCTGAPPSSVMVHGLDPGRSSEWCVPSEVNAPIWEWNRFVFLFLLDADDFPPKKAEQFGFGANGYIYVARIASGTEYMSQGGTIGNRKEAAFPEVIAPSCIIGVFQYTTGNQETPPRPKMLYTLKQLSATSPYNQTQAVQGSNALNSPNSAGIEVKRILNIP